ncbi:MAG: hypothetical protein EPN57_04545 [Paraburkholderia sp.]|nr:MAG: hypothetical protein EPN57_04545 [Paraburkholderia sp.]
MSFSTGGLQSTQQCRVRFSRHLPGERLTVTVVDKDPKGWVIWALSDLPGDGKFQITSTLTGRTLALASLTISYNAMIFVAPGSAEPTEEREKFIAPVVDSFLTLWAGQRMQSIGLCFTSTQGSSSKAMVEFALGGDLESMYPLPQSTTQVIPWPV